MEAIDQCVIEQAENFLSVTKHIFQYRGFCFSTAFIIGDRIDIVKLDLSSEEQKQSYSQFIKRRFYQTKATHLIVIQRACVYQLSPEQMMEIGDESSPGPKPDENTKEALVVFISSRDSGEVWQVPFTRGDSGIVFEEKRIHKTITSANWMINRNGHLAAQMN